MKQDIKSYMKLVSANVNLMQVFVIINMKINADVNAKSCLTKECGIKDLIGILAIVNVNEINHVMLENIWNVKTVSVEKG